MAQAPIHPGEHLKEELQAIDMSAAELAPKLAVPTNRVAEAAAVANNKAPYSRSLVKTI